MAEQRVEALGRLVLLGHVAVQLDRADERPQRAPALLPAPELRARIESFGAAVVGPPLGT